METTEIGICAGGPWAGGETPSVFKECTLKESHSAAASSLQHSRAAVPWGDTKDWLRLQS